MQLKQYQQEVLLQLADFLTALDNLRKEEADTIVLLPLTARKKIKSNLDFVKEAWQQINGDNKTYFPKKDRLQKPLLDVYLKVPTRGGKTLLACHTIEHIQQQFLNRQNGQEN